MRSMIMIVWDVKVLVVLASRVGTVSAVWLGVMSVAVKVFEIVVLILWYWSGSKIGSVGGGLRINGRHR